MSHTYEKVSGNKAKLTFTVPAEQFDEAMQKAYLKLRGRINVPGFRKGKAPRSLIERMYGEGVFYDDAFEMIFPDVYEAAVKEYDLHPVDRPEIDLDEIGAGKDLKFHLEVFVRPDVKLGDYKGLTVEAEQQKLTDEMIDARISQDHVKSDKVSDVVLPCREFLQIVSVHEDFNRPKKLSSVSVVHALELQNDHSA